MKNLIYSVYGTVAKLIFISNYVYRTDTEKTIFANLKTFYYMSCPPTGDKTYMDSTFATTPKYNTTLQKIIETNKKKNSIIIFLMTLFSYIN